jgi:hypothetical protein
LKCCHIAASTPDPNLCHNQPLEFLDIRAIIRQSPTIKQIIKPLEENSPVSDVGSTDVKGFMKSGHPAKNRQLIHRVFSHTIKLT